MDEYQRAVEILKDYVESEGVELFSSDTTLPTDTPSTLCPSKPLQII